MSFGDDSLLEPVKSKVYLVMQTHLYPTIITHPFGQEKHILAEFFCFKNEFSLSQVLCQLNPLNHLVFTPDVYAYCSISIQPLHLFSILIFGHRKPLCFTGTH